MPDPTDEQKAFDIEEYTDRVTDIENRIDEIPVKKDLNPSQLQSHLKSIAIQKRFLINLLLFHGNVSRARRATGVGPAFVGVSRKSNPEFKKIMDSIYSDIVDIAEEELVKKVVEGDMRAIVFMLKTKGRDRGYGDRIELSPGSDDFSKRLIDAKERARAKRIGESGGDGSKFILEAVK